MTYYDYRPVLRVTALQFSLHALLRQHDRSTFLKATGHQYMSYLSFDFVFTFLGQIINGAEGGGPAAQLATPGQPLRGQAAD